MPNLLHHYTCAHSATGIDADGVLRPHWQPLLGRSLVWLTDLDDPVVDALGLTSQTLSCDRTRVRYTVPRQTPGIHWWPLYARQVGDARRVVEEYGMPVHWWVSERDVPVLGAGVRAGATTATGGVLP